MNRSTQIRVDGGAPITLAKFYRDNPHLHAADRADFERDLVTRSEYLFGGGAAAVSRVTLASRDRPGKVHKSQSAGSSVLCLHKPGDIGGTGAVSTADAVTITAMAADIFTLDQERGADVPLEIVDLQRKGWTRAQIEKFGSDAVAAFRTGRDRASRRRAA